METNGEKRVLREEVGKGQQWKAKRTILEGQKYILILKLQTWEKLIKGDILVKREILIIIINITTTTTIFIPSIWDKVFYCKYLGYAI